MADNIKILDSDGNVVTIATDDVAGVDFQKNKVSWGGPDTANDTTEETPFPVQLAASSTAEGTTPHRSLAASDTPIAIKASEGLLYQVLVDNPNGADDAHFHLYNSESVVVGTTTPVLTFRVKPGEKVSWRSAVGTKFGTAIRYAVTKESTGTNAPTTPLIVNAEFK